MMNNTALRAEVQSTDNTHMVFANDGHEKFYFEKLEQADLVHTYHSVSDGQKSMFGCSTQHIFGKCPKCGGDVVKGKERQL